MKRCLLPLLLAAASMPVLRGLPGERQGAAGELARTLDAELRTEILEASSAVLDHSVNFRGDGTASSVYLGSQDTVEFEWRGLEFRQLVTGTVSEGDRASGIERRYYAQIHARSFRMRRDGHWSAWKTGPCPHFPGFVLVEETDGQLCARQPKLARFHPGPDANDPTGPLTPRERLVASR